MSSVTVRNAGFKALIIVLFIFCGLAISIPSKSLVASEISNVILQKDDHKKIDDIDIRAAIDLGLLKEFVAQRINESNLLIIKIYEINDDLLISIIHSQKYPPRIKYIGVAGQLFEMTSTGNAIDRSKYKINNGDLARTLEEYLPSIGRHADGGDAASILENNIYVWNTEKINDASVDYFRDTVLLRIYRRSWAAAILNLGNQGRDVTVMFDWEITADGWGGTPAISVVNSKTFNLRGCDLELNRECGEPIAIANRHLRLRHFGQTHGTYETTVNGEKLIFFIIPSDTSQNEGHANTYFKINNLKVL